MAKKQSAPRPTNDSNTHRGKPPNVGSKRVTPATTNKRPAKRPNARRGGR
jgi:hypothetical protein